MLRRVLDALEADALETALERLCSAWAQRPAPTIAALINTASELAAASRPGFRAGTLADLDSEWLSRAREARAADVPLLLPALAEGSNLQILERARLLANFPADPRITQALAALVVRQPFHRTGTMRFWEVVHGVLRSHPDPLALARLAADRPVQAPRSGHKGERSLWRMRRESVELLRAHTQPDTIELSEEALALCEQIAARLAARPMPIAARLLAAVFEFPHDSSRRRVLADYLLDQGDPRGELIALQLAETLDPAGRQRLELLLETQIRRWLGPLARVLDPTELEFAGGFVRRAKFDPAARDPAATAESPYWATLEALDTPPDAVAAHANLRALRHLHCSAAAARIVFDDDRVRPSLEHLEFFVQGTAPEILRRFHHAVQLDVGLPALRELTINLDYDRFPIAWNWAWASPALAHLEQLTIVIPRCGIDVWLEQLAEDFVCVARISFLTRAVSYRLGEREDGRFRALSMRATGPLPTADPVVRARILDDIEALVPLASRFDRIEIDPTLANETALGTLLRQDRAQLVSADPGAPDPAAAGADCC